MEGISAGIVSDHFADIYDNAYEAILRMEKRYKGPIAFEYTHINNNTERGWLKEELKRHIKVTLNNNEKRALFKQLAYVEGFEKYLHKTSLVQSVFQLKG